MLNKRKTARIQTSKPARLRYRCLLISVCVCVCSVSVDVVYSIMFFLMCEINHRSTVVCLLSSAFVVFLLSCRFR